MTENTRFYQQTTYRYFQKAIGIMSLLYLLYPISGFLFFFTKSETNNLLSLFTTGSQILMFFYICGSIFLVSYSFCFFPYVEEIRLSQFYLSRRHTFIAIFYRFLLIAALQVLYLNIGFWVLIQVSQTICKQKLPMEYQNLLPLSFLFLILPFAIYYFFELIKNFIHDSLPDNKRLQSFLVILIFFLFFTFCSIYMKKFINIFVLFRTESWMSLWKWLSILFLTAGFFLGCTHFYYCRKDLS